jgi:hypothetical protein
MSERLIESVNAVTELLRSNTNLRNDIEKMNQISEKKDIEIFNVRNVLKFIAQH